VTVGQLLENPHLLVHHLEAAAAEVVSTLAAHQAQRADLGALDDERAARLDDVRVEAAAQPLVGGHDDDERLAAGPRLARGEQRVRRRIDARRQAREHALHLLRERARTRHALLRAAQLRRGDHFHRLRNLLRVLHRTHAAPEVNQ